MAGFPYIFPIDFLAESANFPLIEVRAAFASAAFSGSPTWNGQLDTDGLELSIRRGRQHELDRIEAGTAQVVLKNLSGNYWPNNSGGAYYPNVLPGKRLNVRATFDAVTYDLYTGFIESWNHGFASSGDKVPIVKVTCADLLKKLNALLLTQTMTEEFSDVRIDRIFDALGWPAANRDIANGQTILQGELLLAKNAAEHSQVIQQSEMGAVFIAGDGDVQFHDRHQRLRSPYTVSQATFGDDAGEMGYHGIDFDHSDKFIFNDVRINRVGGTEQIATDAPSITTYGAKAITRSNLLFITDTESKNQAERLLSLWKNPQFRVKAITVRPQGNPTNLFPKVLAYDIGTRITLRLDRGNVDKEMHIEGITHKIAPKFWETVWELSDAEPVVQYWILGTSTLGNDSMLGF